MGERVGGGKRNGVSIPLVKNLVVLFVSDCYCRTASSSFPFSFPFLVTEMLRAQALWAKAIALPPYSVNTEQSLLPTFGPECARKWFEVFHGNWSL